MDFPIESLMDEEKAEAWVLDHFHPLRRCIRMAGVGIIVLSVAVRLFFIKMVSGRETQMVMV